MNPKGILATTYNELLYYLEDMHKGKKSNNKYKYTEDVKKIRRQYQYYKLRL